VGDATTLEVELRRIEGGERPHGPVMAWELRDAVLSGSYIYKRSLKHRVDARNEGWFKLAPTERIPEGVLSCSYFGGLYFGHAIRDDMPLTLLAESMGTPGGPARPCAPGDVHAHGTASRAYDARFDRLLLSTITIKRDRIQRTREIRSGIGRSARWGMPVCS
jgi:hypothetical protein